MNIISFFISALLFLNQFSPTNKDPYAPNKNTIQIDISKAITETEPFLSKFKITKVVKLKGEDKTRISASAGRKIIDRDNKIYISDDVESNLYIFDYDGNYVSKVGSKGKGPDEFEFIFDFTILEDGSYVVLDKKGIMLFDKNKQFVNTNNQSPNQICKLKNNEYAVYFDANSTNNVIVYNADYDVKEELFPSPKEKHSTSGLSYKGGIKASSNGILYNETSSPVFHEIRSNGTIYPKYEVTGNAHIWPYEKRNELKSFSKKITEKAEIIYPFYPFQETKNAFIFTLALEDGKVYTFFYDKISKKLYKPALLQEPYMAAFFKPIFGLNVNQNNEFINPIHMHQFYQKYPIDSSLKSTLTKYFPELLTLAEGTNEYSNPALVYFTFGE